MCFFKNQTTPLPSQKTNINHVDSCFHFLSRRSAYLSDSGVVSSFSVQGLKDLVWLPIEQYRKDGRIVRGFQRGAASFGTSTAMAALELTNRMVQTIQVQCMTPEIRCKMRGVASKCSVLSCLNAIHLRLGASIKKERQLYK